MNFGSIALTIVVLFFIVQFIYEAWRSSDNDSLFIREKDVTRSVAGKPITEIIVDF